MERQHTPAPWYDDETGEYITTARVIRRNGIVICRMECRYPMKKPEADANARLIVAAPELHALVTAYRAATSRTGVAAVLVDRAALDAADAAADALLARIDEAV